MQDRLDLRPRRLLTLLKHAYRYSPVGRFFQAIGQLVWQYRWYSLAIFVVTIFQEFAALWPVNLLGEFIDRLDGGDMGTVVWRFLLASLFYPGLLRANVMLRHKMFYETDFQKLVELVVREADRGHQPSIEDAGSAYTRLANAVSGITNATYHVLGSFTPVVIKIVIVAGNLLAYNRSIGLVYLASLSIPVAMTVVFNRRLRTLLDSQYAVVSEVSGTAIKTISDPGNKPVRDRFLNIMDSRKRILQSLVYRGQSYLYLREAVLVGSQFVVVFMALAIRVQAGITAGDFTKIVGYTTQVAAAFITTASVLDAIVSYSRAYHVYALGEARGKRRAQDVSG
jgi:hypothetical protein